MTSFHPKPDDRSDNVEKLQQMVHNTLENIEKSEETLMNTDGNEKSAIEAKNERRRQSIEGMRQEIEDEAEHANGYHEQ